MSTTHAAAPALPAADLSAAKTRVVKAALTLFAQHGVGGTSLHMIADEIGVTKAAVYHQFNTKEEIIRAVADTELARLEEVLDEAQASARGDVRDAVIEGIINLAVSRRRLMGNLLSDPVIGRLYAKDKRLIRVLDRLNSLLLGDSKQAESHVVTAMLTAAISGSVIHPLVMDLSDDTLRAQLGRLARRFLDLPPG